MVYHYKKPVFSKAPKIDHLEIFLNSKGFFIYLRKYNEIFVLLENISINGEVNINLYTGNIASTYANASAVIASFIPETTAIPTWTGTYEAVRNNLLPGKYILRKLNDLPL